MSYARIARLSVAIVSALYARTGAASCAEFSHVPCCPEDLQSPLGEPLAQARDFAPWAELDEELVARLATTECSFTAQRVAPVPAVVDVVPMADLATEELARGCESEQRFGKALARFMPMSPLASDADYALDCGELHGLHFEFVTSQTDRSPAVPAIEVVDVFVADGASCTEVPALWLELRGVNQEFFLSGGILVLSYDDGRIDYAHLYSTVTQHGDTMDVPFFLPLESDSIVTLTAFDGGGGPGEPMTIDVRGLGENDRIARCDLDHSGREGTGAWVLLAALALGRRRVRQPLRSRAQTEAA